MKTDVATFQCGCVTPMWWATSEKKCIDSCPSSRPVEFKANHTCIVAADCDSQAGLSVASNKCVCGNAKKWSVEYQKCVPKCSDPQHKFWYDLGPNEQGCVY